MNILGFCGCAVVVCVLLVLLRQYSPDIAVCAAVASGAVMLVYLLRQLAPIIAQLNALISAGGIAQESIAVIVKVLGISLAAQLAADICRDAGQSALAAKVDIAGRAAILLVTLPLLAQVLSIAQGIIKG